MLYSFDSLDDYLRALRERSRIPGRFQASHDSDDVEFRGTRSYEEAVSLATNGWAEGERLARTYMDTLISKMTSIIEKITYTYDVEGLTFDIARVVEGEPESWIQPQVTFADGPSRQHYRLALHVGAGSGVKTESMIARGAVAGALTEALSIAGHAVEIYAVYSNPGHYGDGDHRQRILVKSADQPLDLARAIFVLAHPSMLRRLAFAFMETAADAPRDYGRSQDVGESERGDIYFPRLNARDAMDWRNSNEARLWIIAQLKNQGIQLIDGGQEI